MNDRIRKILDNYNKQIYGGDVIKHSDSGNEKSMNEIIMGRIRKAGEIRYGTKRQESTTL